MTEKEKKILTMLKLMKTNESIKNQVLSLTHSLDSVFTVDKDSNITDDLKDKFLEGYLDLWDFDGLMELLSPTYDKCFSETEIDEMIELFSTPVYQRFVEMQPEILGDFANIMGTWMANRMPVAEEYVNKFVEEVMDKEDWQKDSEEE